VPEASVASAFGGHEHSKTEDVWSSVEAFEAATALSRQGPSRRRDGQRVPRGVRTPALASAWHRRTEALRPEVRHAHGYFFEGAMTVWALAMSAAAESAAAFDLFRQEVARLRHVAVVPPTPVRFDAGDILGWRSSRNGEDETELSRNMRRCSSSVDADGLRPARGYGGAIGDRCARVLCLWFSAVCS